MLGFTISKCFGKTCKGQKKYTQYVLLPVNSLVYILALQMFTMNY